MYFRILLLVARLLNWIEIRCNIIKITTIHYEMWTVVASTILCTLMYTKNYKTVNLKISGNDKIA